MTNPVAISFEWYPHPGPPPLFNQDSWIPSAPHRPLALQELLHRGCGGAPTLLLGISPSACPGWRCAGSFTPFWPYVLPRRASQVAPVVKNLPPDAGDIREWGSIPGSGRSWRRSVATRSSILAWRTPWTDEPGGLQSIGSRRVRHDWSGLALTPARGRVSAE